MQHAHLAGLGVDVLGLEAQGLVEAQAAAVEHHQQCTIADGGGRSVRAGFDELPHFFTAQRFWRQPLALFTSYALGHGRSHGLQEELHFYLRSVTL
jgi:hypothetical protein